MTFSIIAKDQATGAFGVATATGGPAVGSLVPHAAPGIGAIATQGHTTNPFYGISGLAQLGLGVPADQVLERLVAADPERQMRQCIIIDCDGRTASHSGTALGEMFGAITAKGYAMAGNLLHGAGVLQAMERAFLAAHEMPLADRLLAAMLAGQDAGGDRRGTRSAALKVYTDQAYPAVDLRADWSRHPIIDLAEILQATRGTEYAEFFARLPRQKANRDKTPQPVENTIK